MLQAIIFDMDGVLIDSHPIHRQAWQQFLLTLDQQVSDAELDFILEGRKREDILRHFLGDDLSEVQIAEYGKRKDEIFRQAALHVRPAAGVIEFLDHLEGYGIRKGVATSASAGRTFFTLDRLQLTQRFATIVTGNDVVHGKPDPAVYELAARRLNARPESVLVIEDAVPGVSAAKDAGMKCLAIADCSRREALRYAGADHVVPNFVGLSLPELEPFFGFSSGRRALWLR